MTDFPLEQILIISLVRFAEPIAFTSLFPYVYFMVKNFSIASSEAEIAKYSGYLSSTFAFSQFLTCYNWGSFADKHSRKPTLMIGLFGTIVSLLMLWFAKNYYWAFFARTLNGLLNGNIAVIRTLIGENVTERKHQAVAFSTMPLVWQIGCVIGPMIGGFMSGRNTSIDWLRPLAQRYPYVLPNIFISVLLFASMIIAVFFLEETHYQHKYRRDYFVEAGDFIRVKILGLDHKERPWHTDTRSGKLKVPAEVGQESALLDDYSEIPYTGAGNDDLETSSIHSAGALLTRRESTALIRAYSLHELEDDEEQEDGESWRTLLKHHIFYAVVCNFLMSLHLTVNDEFLPVYLAYDIAKDPQTGSLLSKFPFHITGGLNYTSEDTGKLLSLTGMFGIFTVLFVFPYVDRNYKSLPIYKTMILAFPLCYTVTPYLVFLANSKTLSMAFAYSLTTLKSFANSIAFPQILFLVHNTSPAKHRAMINGATISISTLARSAGPLLWGYIFAYGQLHNVGWLPWWSLTALSLLAVYYGKFLREEHEYEEDKKVSSERQQWQILSLAFIILNQISWW